MRPLLPTALLVFFVHGCSCGEVLGGVPGSVKGRVCDPDTGVGLAGAGLVLDGAAGLKRNNIADGHGGYVIEGVPAGQYTLTATFHDLVRTFDVAVQAQEIAIITDTACRGDPNAPPSGDLTGQICNRHTGQLITDGEVIVQLADGELLVGHTDASGNFTLNGVPEGDHIVTVRGDGFQRSFLVTVVAGQTATLALGDGCTPVSATEGGIVGSFCDPATDGNLVGAAVTVQPVGGGDIATDVTDTDGTFEINGLTPGAYQVRVVGGALNFTAASVLVVAGQLAPITDPSSCANRPEYGRIQGEICDTDAGGRFAGAVDLIQGVTVVDSAISDDNGRFAFNMLPPGGYTVRAHRDAYERVFAGVVVQAFRTTFLQEQSCPAPQDVCTEFTNQPDITADGRIMLVVDRSGSMDQPGSDGVRKWDALRASLESVTASLTASVEFGLMMFPSNPNADSCSGGGQIFGLAKNNASQIAGRLDSTTPNGGTPTAVTLNTARDILAAIVPDGRPLAVLLATDGAPNCNGNLHRNSCTCTTGNPNPPCGQDSNCLDDTNAINGVAAIEALGVNTFVLGLPGTENFAPVLTNMAIAGRSGHFYAASDQAGLQQAVEAIAQQVLTCRVNVGAGLDGANSVTVRVGSQTIARDGGRQNGWDQTSPTSIELFGSACDLAASSAENVVVRTCVSP